MMRIKLKKSVFVLFLLTISSLSLSTIYAETSSEKCKSIIDVGETSLKVPVPDGFHEIDESYPDIFTYFNSYIPPQNKLLAFFINDQDYNKILDGRDPDFHTYIHIQVMEEIKDIYVTKENFKSAVSNVRSINKSLYRNINSQDFTLPTMSEINSNENIMLGYFIDENHVFGFQMIKSPTIYGEKISNFSYINSVNYLLINNKLIFVYFCTIYDGQESVDWVHDKTASWIGQMFEVNKKTYSESTYSQTNNESRWEYLIGQMIGKGLATFLVLSLFAGIYYISRQLKSSSSNNKD